MSPQTTVTEEFKVTSGSDSATVRKLWTPRGQLVEIESDQGDGEEPSQMRIDALGLESLSWQTEADLVDRLDYSPPAEWDGQREPEATAESFKITNEYADAVVSKISLSNGDALVVRSPVKRTEFWLHPAMVRELTACTTDLFSEFLETPHGPHDH